MTESMGPVWCQFHVANPSFGSNGTSCDLFLHARLWTPTGNVFNVWTANNIKQYQDGVLLTSCKSIAQTTRCS